MSLNESIVEDAVLEWFLLRNLLRQGYEGQDVYGGKVGSLGLRLAPTFPQPARSSPPELPCLTARLTKSHP